VQSAHIQGRSSRRSPRSRRRTVPFLAVKGPSIRRGTSA